MKLAQHDRHETFEFGSRNSQAFLQISKERFEVPFAGFGDPACRGGTADVVRARDFEAIAGFQKGQLGVQFIDRREGKIWVAHISIATAAEI